MVPKILKHCQAQFSYPIGSCWREENEMYINEKDQSKLYMTAYLLVFHLCAAILCTEGSMYVLFEVVCLFVCF